MNGGTSEPAQRQVGADHDRRRRARRLPGRRAAGAHRAPAAGRRARPFPIICGTSAGAINAAVLAVDAHRLPARRAAPHDGVEELPRRTTSTAPTRWARFGTARAGSASLLAGGASTARSPSRCSTTRRSRRCSRAISISPAIQRTIDARRSRPRSASPAPATPRGSRSLSTRDGRAASPGSARAASASRCRSRVEHLLASSALPFIFRPVHINREYFGDGSMRQIAPVSPALHLGADRLLVIGVGRQLQPKAERTSVDTAIPRSRRSRATR